MDEKFINSGLHINKMENNKTVLHPINALERKIFSDKEFLTAIMVGRPREYHLEGTVKSHIINILEYIETQYKSSEEYENLRVLTILHDVGKFAFLEKFKEKYLPEMSTLEQKRFIIASRTFAKKYPVPKNIKQDFREYKLTSQHAYVSYLFAKKYLKNKTLLEIIKYHDTAQDFLRIFEDTGKYDINKFKEIFSKIDIKFYLLFVDCDRCGRNNEVIPWMKEQLKLHKII